MNDKFKENSKRCRRVRRGRGRQGFSAAGVSAELSSKLHAGNLIKEIVKEVGGSGGGRPDMAQAGGNRPEKLDDALGLAERLVLEKLG